MGWAYEMFQLKKLLFLRISFLIASWSHEILIKSSLFLHIAQVYNKSDIFTTQELKNVISLMPNVIN